MYPMLDEINRQDRTTFNHKCDVEGCWITKNAAPFGALKDCFGGKIRPTDIDGIVERNGHFLIFEWKRDGVPIPLGQKILFEKLTIHEDITVFVVWHEVNRPEIVTKAGMFKSGAWKGERATDLAGVRKACAQWFNRVQKSY